MLRIMRLLCISILSVFCVLLLSCCSIGQKDTGENSNDTIVCKKKIQGYLPKYHTYEYFVINKGDTSSYSFTFISDVTRPHDCILEIVNWPRYKRYLIPKDIIISCHEPNYKDFLKEMDLCLNVALKDSINLKYIAFLLSNCTDIAVKTSKLFYSTRNQEINYQNILDALKRTTLKEDFDKILKKYNLHVVREDCNEEIYLIGKSEFKKVYKGKEILPDTILDVNVDLNISPVR